LPIGEGTDRDGALKQAACPGSGKGVTPAKSPIGT